MTTSPDPNDLESVYRTMLAQRIAKVAAGLRDAADAVARYGAELDRVPSLSIASYTAVAAKVQHETLWMLSNLNLDGLTGLAHEIDEFRTAPKEG